MRVLIVDDERPARDKLRRLLAAQPDVASVEEARDGLEALKLAAVYQPDVIFLDIQMPEMDGVEMAAALPAPHPVLVFVTAYDQYALQAFDANAVDYLLKPYDEARFLRTLVRVRQRLLIQPAASEQLLISERGRIRIIKVSDIQWLAAADNYVVIHTATEQPLMRQTLGGLIDHLGAAFVRTQKSAAVHLPWVEAVETLAKGDGEVLLRGGARIPCSRQYRAELLARLAISPLP